jgi:hypothetical protein
MTDDAAQKNLWEVRKAGLNIMMSLQAATASRSASLKTAPYRWSTWPNTPTR